MVEMVEEVLRQLDELSVRMVVGGADQPETLQLIAAIEIAAREAGRVPAADAAAELKARATGALKRTPDKFEQVVTSGIDNLRRALEAAAQPEAAPVNKLAQDLELIGDFVNEAGEHLAVGGGPLLVQRCEVVVLIMRVTATRIQL